MLVHSDVFCVLCHYLSERKVVHRVFKTPFESLNDRSLLRPGQIQSLQHEQLYPSKYEGNLFVRKNIPLDFL